MAELPELTILQQQMNEALSGKRVELVEALQEKCLNMPADQFVQAVTGSRITEVSRLGKWLFFHLEPERFILLNLGMGADLRHFTPGTPLPAKYQFRLQLDDGTGFTCRFWWFGYIKLLTPQELSEHKETNNLGPSPMEITFEQFSAVASAYPKCTVKSLILDQSKLAGIGNAYAHDILWKAKLHPKRKLGTLSQEDLRHYFDSIRWIVNRAIELTGLEPDFYSQGGNITDFEKLFIIGYRDGKPCPECGTTIEKIKTGSTQTFICPRCQKVQ